MPEEGRANDAEPPREQLDELRRERDELAGRVAELEQALVTAGKQRDQFLAVLGHELRNPLAAIRNAVTLQHLVAADDPRRRRMDGIIDRQTALLARLIDDLLDVSRIARGKIQLRRETLDLGDLVREIVEDRQEAACRGGLSLSVDTPARPMEVDGDRSRLGQVVDNLLSNAMKFTDPGGRVAIRLSPDGERHVLLEVVDNGIGMDARTLESAFDSFTQADQGLDRGPGGLGLGLALVKGLVDLHGGEVEAHSAGHGAGSRFVVRIPAAAQISAEVRAVAGGLGAPARVVIIDDNRDSADSLRELLVTAGYEAAAAYDVAGGVTLARELRPDVVLCDLVLSGEESGLDVAAALRADEELVGTLLIALTGLDSAEERMRALQGGFDVHLTKPVNLKTLALALGR